MQVAGKIVLETCMHGGDRPALHKIWSSFRAPSQERPRPRRVGVLPKGERRALRMTCVPDSGPRERRRQTTILNSILNKGFGFSIGRTRHDFGTCDLCLRRETVGHPAEGYGIGNAPIFETLPPARQWVNRKGRPKGQPPCVRARAAATHLNPFDLKQSASAIGEPRPTR